MMWNWCANNSDVIMPKVVLCWLLNRQMGLVKEDTIKLNMLLSPQKSPRKRSTGPFDQVTSKNVELKKSLKQYQAE